MTDIVSKAKRSEMMSKRPTTGTRPEREVVRVLRRLHYRAECNRRDLPGSPDVVLPSIRTVIFVHGCFWHYHRSATCTERPRPSIPDDNRAFWARKLLDNLARDKRTVRKLRRLGWSVKTVWECQTKQGAERLRRILRSKLARRRTPR